MMKILVCLVVLVAVAQAAKETCRAFRGRTLVTFGGTAENFRFPCKYNAIRDNRCGNFRITLTPGNMLENDRNKLYVIKTMFVSVLRLSDGLKWEGRTDLKIARKYLDGIKEHPFNTKGGDLDISKIVTFGPATADEEVSMTAKNGDFKIVFSLYEPYGRWHKNSRFSFECFSDKFEPSPYPDQVCGNGTVDEVKTFKKSMEWKDNRQATTFFNIFSNPGIIQTDNDCIRAQTAMTSQCQQQGRDLRYKASKLCWPLVGKPIHQRCLSQNMDSPISAFRHCVEFVCSGYTDSNACSSLGDELDLCPSLPEVTDKVKETCKNDLVST